MKVTGSATIRAPVPVVWDALHDRAMLSRTIPGCSALEAVGPDAYRMTVTASIAQVRGTYATQVRLTDSDPHRSYLLRASGQGASGTVDATVAVRLSEVPAVDGFTDATRVDYDWDVVAQGTVGGVGQRVLASAANKVAGEFFAAVDRALTAKVPAAHPGEGTTEPAPEGPTSRLTGRRTWPMVAAFGGGAAAALAGVGLRHLATRRRR